MATLETQYKNFLMENPASTLTYDKWMKKKSSKLSNKISKSQPNILDNLQIGNGE
jgi:hypothetical protein